VLPHTQGNSGSLEIMEYLRDTQENSRNFSFSLKLKEILRFKKSQKKFMDIK